MTETEKFRTERLVARSWQIEDLLLAMELWGDPAVTALTGWDEASAQSLVQIRDQVVGILNANRNANKRRRDTQQQPFFFRDVRMGHRRWMRS